MSAFDKSTDDALVGLWFEMGGGLGRMTGQIVAKAGHLYLVRRDGSDHLELMELDDLRAARFFKAANQLRSNPGSGSSVISTIAAGVTSARVGTPAGGNASPSAATVGKSSATALAPAIETPGIPSPPQNTQSDTPNDEDFAKPRRLGDQIRRAVRGRTSKS